MLRDRARPTASRQAPFRCVEFSIASRRSGGFIRKSRWLVDVRGIDWHERFSGPNAPRYADEEAFRRLAALSGWRLMKVVPVNARERRLFYKQAY
jgi:hypothetical protein